MSRKLLFLFLSVYFSTFTATAKIIWTIGNGDNSGSELALGPSDYKKFLANDFGYEDRFFLIGTSSDKTDFPYVMPGPDDTWGGIGGLPVGEHMMQTFCSISPKNLKTDNAN